MQKVSKYSSRWERELKWELVRFSWTRSGVAEEALAEVVAHEAGRRRGLR